MGGRFSAPERIALLARVAIDKLKTTNSGVANSYVANSATIKVANSDIANSAKIEIANSDIANLATTEIANSGIANSATTEIANSGIANSATTEIANLDIANMVLDMKEDHKIMIILERPFLATAHAMIDVFNKKISFEVGSETITFDIEKSMKFSTHGDDNLLSEDMIDKAVIDLDETEDLYKSGPFSDHDNLDSNEITRPTLFTTNTRDAEKQPLKLKELPLHLEYAFLSNDQEFLVIISSLLNPQEKESLLKVLTKYKAALAWKVSDIKGISPSFFIHKILMEDNFKPVVQPQRRLNPKVQDVVKDEIFKLLDSGLIYAILDSP
ncbi:hypothetical protein Tco_1069707 [Tanacetum coccineum]|uniref:Reverse transcriptase domain-containing protein n=1 Tax=Tanacetum coccineum TaxID=301880 RepID=A0ABQ5HL83_9ASTR